MGAIDGERLGFGVRAIRGGDIDDPDRLLADEECDAFCLGRRRDAQRDWNREGLARGQPPDRDHGRVVVSAHEGVQRGEPAGGEHEQVRKLAAVIATPPLRATSRATYPMRRMLVSRSSFEKPRPFERWVRTSSPSSSSAWRPRRSSSAASALAIVDLPAPESPVNQTTKPLLMLRSRAGPSDAGS